MLSLSLSLSRGKWSPRRCRWGRWQLGVFLKGAPKSRSQERKEGGSIKLRSRLPVLSKCAQESSNTKRTGNGVTLKEHFGRVGAGF